jgi:hypothetical protein|tara:strand:- start:12 stop:953 length:942 start_codon:yes stop_codon:yes gene_type:complete
MKIGFFSEAGYEGKVERNHPNMRTDVAWVCALNANHHPLPTLHQLPDNLYDFGIVIIPKKREYLLNYPLISELKRVCKKISTMQESTYYYWQDDPIEHQIWYYNTIMEMDLILCHNEPDLKYYRGITNKRCELMPTLMITDNVKVSDKKTDSVMIGGNFVSAYGGFDSYMVARELSDNIWAPTTGRMKEEERGMDINHIGWVMWLDWMYELSKHKYGIQLGTAAAGTFNLNCAYLGIPCIGYNNVNTQIKCHPNLSVDVGDIQNAKGLATKLKSDKDFYEECSKSSKQKYNDGFGEYIYIYKMKDIIKKVISE